MISAELFLDFYVLGVLIFFVRRVSALWSFRLSKETKSKYFLSVVWLIVISLLASFFWLFMIWNSTDDSENENTEELFSGERKLFQRFMFLFLIACGLNSCSTSELDIYESRLQIKQEEREFEAIPKSDLVLRNIASYELYDSINAPGVYGWVHKSLGGWFLGTSKYLTIFEDTAQTWRQTTKSTDFLSPYEAKLFDEVKAIPSGDLQANISGYQKLAKLNPSNQLYRDKLANYENKNEVATQEIGKAAKQEAFESCKSDMKYKASKACAADKELAYCGIVIGKDNVIGSGCARRVNSKGYNWCVKEVAEALIDQSC